MVVDKLSMNDRLYPEDVSKWTYETVKFLSDNEIEESQYLEYKEHLLYPEHRDPEPSEREWRKNIEREITAFANAHGGIILFGMSDDYDICPFKPPRNDIKKSVIQCFKSATPIPEVTVSDPLQIPSSDSNRILVAVKVEEATRKPISTSDAAYYRRVGDQKQPMSREQLESMFIEADRRQQAIRLLEIQISRLRASYDEQLKLLPRSEEVPPLAAVDENAIRDALLQNTHLFAKEETESIVVGILEELDRISTLKNIFQEGTRNIGRVGFDSYSTLNKIVQIGLRDRGKRVLELFEQLIERTQLSPPGRRWE